MKYAIGVDIGTTSTKAILYNDRNEVCAVVNEAYPTYRPAPDLAEQDPEEIYQAFQRAIIQLTEQSGSDSHDQIAFLTFSSAMHSVIPIDDQDQPITHSYIWSDNRAQSQIDRLKETKDWLKYYRKTGTPVHPMSPFAKLLWIKEETDLLVRAKKFIGIKEYIFFRLSGKYVVDYSIASATGLFNIHEMDWDQEILWEIGLSKEKLSQLVDVTAAFSFQSEQLAEEWGLSTETQLFIGASDGCLANLGTGALKKGATTLTIGTSGALRMTMNQPVLDEKGRTFCYYLSKDKWVIGGAVNNGGNVVQWLDGILYEEEGKIYRERPAALAATEPGAEGLFFFPYLNGERAPFWDGNIRGTYHGLSAFHTKNHLIRATLEGILFHLKEVFELVREIGGPVTRLHASGGFLRSEEWASLAADILGISLTVTESYESSCFGALLLARKAKGKLEETEEKHTLIQVNEKNRKKYIPVFEEYSWYSAKLSMLQKEGRTHPWHP